MWSYEKRLQYPVRITNPNPKIAQVILSQYGGPDGELGASLRYLSQRYTMPNRKVAGLLTDIGTEELAHLEMVSAIVHQLTRNLTPEEILAQGFQNYYVDHTAGVYPASAAGVPFTAAYINRRAIPSPIFPKISVRSRRPAQPTTTSSAWWMTPMCAIPSRSCGSARSSTISASAKGSA